MRPISRECLDKHGGVETAKRLLAKAEIQEGLMRLALEKRLEISMEALVLKKQYRALFTEAELTESRRRLEKLDYFKKQGSVPVKGESDFGC